MCGPLPSITIRDNTATLAIDALRERLVERLGRLVECPTEAVGDQSLEEIVAKWARDERRRIEVVILRNWIAELKAMQVVIYAPGS